MLQVGNKDQPTDSAAYYERVVDNIIILNTFANGTGTADPIVGWGTYDQGSLTPTGCIFRGNIIRGQNGALFSFGGGATASGNTISDNIAWATGSGTYGDITTGQAQRVDPIFQRESDGLYRIGTNSPAYGKLSTSSNNFSSYVTRDCEALAGRTDCGADHYSATAVGQFPKKRITVDDVGPAATTYLGDPIP